MVYLDMIDLPDVMCTCFKLNRTLRLYYPVQNKYIDISSNKLELSHLNIKGCDIDDTGIKTLRRWNSMDRALSKVMSVHSTFVVGSDVHVDATVCKFTDDFINCSSIYGTIFHVVEKLISQNDEKIIDNLFSLTVYEMYHMHSHTINLKISDIDKFNLLATKIKVLGR